MAELLRKLCNLLLFLKWTSCRHKWRTEICELALGSRIYEECELCGARISTTVGGF